MCFSTNTRQNAMLFLERLHARDLPGFLAPVDYTAGLGPYSPIVSDLNGDGHSDVAVALQGEASVAVLLGSGNGALGAPVSFVVGDNPFIVRVSEFNVDGKPDLATTNLGGASLSVLLGRGDGTFRSAVNTSLSAQPAWEAVGDFNGDGRPDLAVTFANQAGLLVLMGNGKGGFRRSATYSTGNTGPDPSVTAGDLNADGHPDLVVTNGGGASIAVYLNDGNGGFHPRTEYATGDSPGGLAIGDVNRDGRPDLVVANGDVISSTESTVSVLLGNGDGTFKPQVKYVTGLAPAGPVLADFNRDRKVDIATASNQTKKVSVLLGNGDGTFGPQTAYSSPGANPSGLSDGDLNGDRYTDLVVADYVNHAVAVIQNDANWMHPILPRHTEFFQGSMVSSECVATDRPPSSRQAMATNEVSVPRSKTGQMLPSRVRQLSTTTEESMDGESVLWSLEAFKATLLTYGG
jgi:hypothetical protein